MWQAAIVLRHSRTCDRLVVRHCPVTVNCLHHSTDTTITHHHKHWYPALARASWLVLHTVRAGSLVLHFFSFPGSQESCRPAARRGGALQAGARRCQGQRLQGQRDWRGCVLLWATSAQGLFWAPAATPHVPSKTRCGACEAFFATWQLLPMVRVAEWACARVLD